MKTTPLLSPGLEGWSLRSIFCCTYHTKWNNKYICQYQCILGVFCDYCWVYSFWIMFYFLWIFWLVLHMFYLIIRFPQPHQSLLPSLFLLPKSAVHARPHLHLSQLQPLSSSASVNIRCQFSRFPDWRITHFHCRFPQWSSVLPCTYPDLCPHQSMCYSSNYLISL